MTGSGAQMNKRAIVLLSGGLDSILATRMMTGLGIEVVCVNYYIEFAVCGGGPTAAIKAAKMLGVPLKVVDITAEYLGIFRNPRHGYGANINPCIDCKIFMLKKAKAYMAEAGASFLVTGEVLGERPMSQRRDALNIIERDAGVRGILLRPLTAKNMPPTLPEEAGVVDREKLLDIRGRGRTPQLELAAKYGIKEFPNPSGGCLLTDPGFTKRVRDLIAHDDLNLPGLKLLKVGRHLRLSDSAKLVIGRDKKENIELQKLVAPGDVCLRLIDHQGPFSILRAGPRGAAGDALIEYAARVVAQHTKFRLDSGLRIFAWRAGSDMRRELAVSAAPVEEVERIRI
jgi:tRNA U34 2-thiouridine synthase MnmA/TrmU